MAYICPECSRIAKLPDYCCGRSMVSQGSFVCKTCGSSQSSPGNCCNQPMVQV